MKKQTIRDIDLRGKRVFLRVDYNVQFIEDRILDDHRLRESIPTIWALQGAGARIVICSHRGRPGGEVVEELRNAPVAAHLSTLMEQEIRSVPVCVGPEANAAVDALEPGEVLLLENVRFHPEEEANDPDFARALAELADVYVSDAFGTAHRAHASVVGVPAYIPGVAGLLMEREVDYLSRITDAPERPLGLILGGAKVAEKLAILDHLCDQADVICVGGGIANTFLMAQGIGRRGVTGRAGPDRGRVQRDAAGGETAGPEAGAAARRGDQRRRRRDGRCGLGEPDPAGLPDPRHRAGHDPGLPRGAGADADDCLERTDGPVRA